MKGTEFVFCVERSSGRKLLQVNSTEAPVPSTGTTVTSYEELLAALASGAPVIEIGAPFTVEATIEITSAVTLRSANRVALGCPPTLQSSFRVNGAEVVFENLAFTNCLLKDFRLRSGPNRAVT